MFNNDESVKITDCDLGNGVYYSRLNQYNMMKKYDARLVDIYHNYQIVIDEVVCPIEKFYITFNGDAINKDIHLINVKSKYTDILKNSIDKVDYSDVIVFRDTTAFIKLIESNAVIIDEKEKKITIIDKEKADIIVKNWDGMIHDKVLETDAVEEKNKNRFNRNI